ncbi:MAG: dicarboxylate/amino acid:cation symporter [Rhodospirillaceae bacterium]|nr:dicarboxylate/amino acid:cation symporter [Rhodospirillaceae bacterium]
MKKGVTLYILIGLLAGIIVGVLLNAAASDPADLKGVITVFDTITTVFLRLVRTIISPLVITTLTLGIAKMGDASSIGRIGFKAMVFFIGGTLISLTIALVAMSVFHPGEGLHLVAAVSMEPAAQTNLTLQGFIARVFPISIFDAMARNEVLQIVVFSLFAGIGIANLSKEHRDTLVHMLDAGAALMLKITMYVMWAAPAAVFTSIASAVASQGAGVVSNYAAFIGEFYLALALLWAALIAIGGAIIGNRIWPLMKTIRGPALIAFSTTSSEAAYPSLLNNLEQFGVPNRIASFVLPLGYAFNLIGSMLYATMATMFAAQAYDIQMGAGDLALMSFLLFIASKGIAMVPRASLLVVAATLPYLHIPEAAFPFLLAVDHILDTGRTCTNTVACSIATACVAKWEGVLGKPVANNNVEVALAR